MAKERSIIRGGTIKIESEKAIFYWRECGSWHFDVAPCLLNNWEAKRMREEERVSVSLSKRDRERKSECEREKDGVRESEQ